MTTTLISGGTVISAVGRREADVLIDGESIAAILAPGQASALGIVGDAVDRRDRQVRRARRRRRAHPHVAAVRRHRGVRRLRDRLERRGVGRRDDDRRLRRPEHRRERPRQARPLARDGRRAGVDRLRLPPDHRWRRRGVAEGDDLPRRQRGHHQLQAVHGLPRGALLRRRPDPAGDAERIGVRAR